MLVGRFDHLLVPHRAAGLDHRRHPRLGGSVQAVPKRKKGVRRHDRSGHFKPLVRRLQGGDSGADHAAHLARTDADGLPAPGIDDGVGLDEPGHLPGKSQVPRLLGGGLALSHHPQRPFIHLPLIGGLRQQAAAHGLDLNAPAGARERTAVQKAQVALGAGSGDRGRRDGRGDHHFGELPLEQYGQRRAVEFAVEGDDAAEGRGGVGGEG